MKFLSLLRQPLLKAAIGLITLGGTVFYLLKQPEPMKPISASTSVDDVTAAHSEGTATPRPQLGTSPVVTDSSTIASTSATQRPKEDLSATTLESPTPAARLLLRNGKIAEAVWLSRNTASPLRITIDGAEIEASDGSFPTFAMGPESCHAGFQDDGQQLYLVLTELTKDRPQIAKLRIVGDRVATREMVHPDGISEVVVMTIHTRLSSTAIPPEELQRIQSETSASPPPSP